MHELIGVFVAANFTVSDWLILLCPIPAAWFWTTFTFGEPRVWWNVKKFGWLGVVTFLHSLSVLLFLVLIVYAMFTGERIGEAARIPIAAFLLIALISKAVILHIERHNGRVERRRARRATEGEPMSIPTGDAVATIGSPQPVTIPTKYAAAIFPFLLTILWSFQTYIVGGISEVEAYQLLGLIAGTALIRFLPLLKGGWAAALKILASVAAAVFAAIPPIIDVANGGPGWTAETIATVVFTGVLALATQFGVDFRVDAVAKALADPTVDNTELYVLDPDAYKVVEPRMPVRQAEPVLHNTGGSISPEAGEPIDRDH